MLFIVMLAITSKSFAQLCPENIGFENGSFKNWKIYTGTISTSGVSINEVANATLGRHTLQNDRVALDAYGKFPIVPKNAGNYTV
ncbi:MAG: hypothetical protein EOP55_08590, partial [Sphingobacteriales bacterium]